MRYRPLGLDLVVKRISKDQRKGTLIIPGKEKDTQVLVVKVGPGTESEEVGVQEGDSVIIQDRCGYLLEKGTDGDVSYEYLLINKGNIICALELG